MPNHSTETWMMAREPKDLVLTPVNKKKTSHRMFRHIYGVLNKVYLQNFLYGWPVNRETNLMSLLNL